MRILPCLGAVLTALVVGATVRAQVQAKLMVAPPGLQPGALAAQADVVVIGKVVEVEPDPVEAAPFPGPTVVRVSPDGRDVKEARPAKVPYRIAVVKIDERVLGAAGLTQLRVGFPADAPAAGPPAAAPPAGAAPAAVGRIVRPGRVAPPALAEGIEGCFYLSRHHGGDFYALAANGIAPPLLKKDETYARQLDEVKKVAKVIDDPVTALKAKDLAARFHAAHALLLRYRTTWSAKADREAIPAEENKLILELLRELPWALKPGGAPPAVSRW